MSWFGWMWVAIVALFIVVPILIKLYSRARFEEERRHYLAMLKSGQVEPPDEPKRVSRRLQ